MVASDALDFLLVVFLGLFALAWPITLVLAAQRGQWVWFVGILCLGFLAPFYFFQVAADRKKDALEKIQRRRKKERSRKQAHELAQLKREVHVLKEKLG